jgi:hypothetical protein
MALWQLKCNLAHNPRYTYAGQGLEVMKEFAVWPMLLQQLPGT